jgi:TolB-like protein/tetratricopeptide (TPR) repeat protein
VSTAPKAVFLSYASQDADAASEICGALRGLGIEVWFDQNALRGGDAWDVAIRKQIRDCALFVPVISASTQAREEGYFRLEWKLAVDRSYLMADDRAFLLPVAIDATSQANARVPERFREVQWTRVSGPEAREAFARHAQRLLSSAAPSPGPVLFAAANGIPARHVAPSIAVLPFVNRSSDAEDEYFSDGLADELLNVLAKIGGLRVAARSSSFTFKGRGVTVAEVGRALNVSTVLEGSVRKAGNRMRIAVQLVNVADGYHLWSESYDRMLDDIFAVQDDIAQSVVKELRATLLGGTADVRNGEVVTAQVAAAVRGRATQPEAHRLFLQARHFIDRRTGEDMARGIGYLKEALALDRDYALAWAEIGAAYAISADWGWAPFAEGYVQARDAVTRALALEPDLAEGHATMGWIQSTHDWDWRGAKHSFERALELAPGSAAVLRRAATLAGNLGRLDEAIELDRRAVAQDPLSSASYNNLGLHLHAAGQLADAEAAFRKALEFAPRSPASRTNLALALVDQGRGEEALGDALKEPDEWVRLWMLAIVHNAAGRRAESDAALHQFIANYQEDSAYQVAQAYGIRGEADLAFEWLERAFVQRDSGLNYVKADPDLRSLRDDPRWHAFVRKMGLAD